MPLTSISLLDARSSDGDPAEVNVQTLRSDASDFRAREEVVRRDALLRLAGRLNRRELAPSAPRTDLGSPRQTALESPPIDLTTPAKEDALQVINLPRFQGLGSRGESFAAMQEWEGVVVQVCDEVFLAELIDITAGAVEPEETAEVLISDVQDDDRARLKPGAIFRWVVGYHRSPAGQKTRGSRIYFRRTSGQSAPKRDVPDLVFETDE